MIPLVEILLKRLKILVGLFAESNTIELIENRVVEAHADSVRVRRFRLRLGVIGLVDRRIKLIIVLVWPGETFRNTIGKNPEYRQLLL
jgi:hypothetical protein